MYHYTLHLYIRFWTRLFFRSTGSNGLGRTYEHLLLPVPMHFRQQLHRRSLFPLEQSMQHHVWLHRWKHGRVLLSGLLWLLMYNLRLLHPYHKVRSQLRHTSAILADNAFSLRWYRNKLSDRWPIQLRTIQSFPSSYDNPIFHNKDRKEHFLTYIL